MPSSLLADVAHESIPAQQAEEACDACGEVIVPPRDDDDGYAVPGRGQYVWTRGDEVRREEVPLCATCAAAIGMSALARWEIEEEEG